MDGPSQSLRKQKKPSFFKILINDFSTRLLIPPAFIKKFGKDVPNKTILEAYFDKSGEVEVEKLGERFYFSKGWRKFVEYNNLKHGDFLVFKYFSDYSKFKVTIYGKTCCVKQFNVAGEKCSEPLNDEKDQRNVQDGGKRKWDEVDDDLNEDEELKSTRRNKREFDRTKVYEREVINIDSDSSADDQTGDLRQSTCKRRTKAHLTLRSGKCSTLPPDNQIEFNSENPFFQLKLKFSNISGYLHIPTGFFRKHMMKENKGIKFLISKKIWDMDLQVYGRGRVRMREARVSQGWKRFTKENDMEIGDVCIFEMITSDDFVFRVHVYRWDGQKAEFIKIL